MTRLFRDLLFNEGVDLSPELADTREAMLEADPEDMESRAMLLGCYFSKSGLEARARRCRHALWVITNRPETDVAGSPPCLLNSTLDTEDYEEARNQWLRHVGGHQRDPDILGNAAHFFTHSEPELAEDLFRRARDAEPGNPKRFFDLGHFYSRQAAYASAQEAQLSASKALAEFEKGYEQTDDETWRPVLLNDLARSALSSGEIDKAAAYATLLLQVYEEDRDNWNYGNAIHVGNVVLGRIALGEGHIDKAVEHLRAAGQTPGSPQLDTFGPSMALALQLLELGERKAVLEYLALCGRFWEMGQEELQDWTETIRRGRIPDFGSRLAY